MLDFRINTFLELCRCQNYTRTAENLHMTQPAVTQHIQYLEKQFNCKLFEYVSRELTLTKQGKLLLEYASSAHTNLKKLYEHLQHAESDTFSLSLGATENIGEYIMPDIMTEYLKNEKCDNLSFMIGSTDYLLSLLQDGKITFAIVDGQFDKKEFYTELLFVEKTVAICSPDHRLAGNSVPFKSLLGETLIVRASGSAPRTNIEQYLAERNLNIGNFENYIEINNLNVTKKFVQKGMGIAFIYNHALRDEFENNLLGCIDVPDLNMTREINLVVLKDDFFSEEYKTFFNYCHKSIQERKFGEL